MIVSQKTSRIAAAFIIGIILVGLFFGRQLQRAFPELEYLLRYGFLGIILIFGIISIRWFRRGYAQNPQTIIRMLGVAVATVVGVTWITDQMIVAPIERVHVFKYCLLTFFSFHSFTPSLPHWQRALYAFLLVLGVGVGEENLQRFLPDRIYDPNDIALNTVGIIAGLILALTSSF